MVGDRGRRGFLGEREQIEYEVDFPCEVFLQWLEEEIQDYCSVLTRLHRSVVDDIVDGLPPQLLEVDIVTLQLCDLSKLKHDAKAFIARAGLNKAHNYLTRKLYR